MTGRSAMYAAQGKPDVNHSVVIGWYEELYCRVVDTHKVGGGFGDLVVKIPTSAGAIAQIVEVKTLDGELRPSQRRFADEWGPGCVACVSTREDVFSHVESVRARFGKMSVKL